MTTVTSKALVDNKVKTMLKPSLVIEDFQGDWEKEWFTYRPDDWARTTHKLNSEAWKAPNKALLVLKLQSAKPNQMVIVLDQFAAEIELKGKDVVEEFKLQPNDFKNYSGESLSGWGKVKRLSLVADTQLRPPRGKAGPPRQIGKNWIGHPPRFLRLSWSAE